MSPVTRKNGGDPLVDLLQTRYGPPVDGTDWPCPICENDPAATVHVAGGRLYCSACGAGEAKLLKALQSSGNGNGSGLVVRKADLSRSKPPRWAWQDRIVIGYLNLLIGNEGVGKGTLTSWVIARLTRGELPGGLHGYPASVGILGDEDSFDDVWAPRLHAAGADLDRVVQVERPQGELVNVREDHGRLAKTIGEHDLRLLFFDQLLDNLGGVDDWRQKQVREALQPLRALARELQIAVLGSLHPNKRAETFRQLVSGSSAFNAVSRSSLLLAQHPEGEDRRVLVRGKGNLAQPPEAVEFEITSCEFSANGHSFSVPAARGFGTGALTVDDLLAGSADEDRSAEAASQLDEAKVFLLAELGAKALLAEEVKARANRCSISARTLRRARKELGVCVRKTPEGPWEWSLPPAAGGAEGGQGSASGQVGQVGHLGHLPLFAGDSGADEGVEGGQGGQGVQGVHVGEPGHLDPAGGIPTGLDPAEVDR